MSTINSINSFYLHSNIVVPGCILNNDNVINIGQRITCFDQDSGVFSAVQDNDDGYTIYKHYGDSNSSSYNIEYKSGPNTINWYGSVNPFTGEIYFLDKRSNIAKVDGCGDMIGYSIIKNSNCDTSGTLTLSYSYNHYTEGNIDGSFSGTIDINLNDDISSQLVIPNTTVGVFNSNNTQLVVIGLHGDSHIGGNGGVSTKYFEDKRTVTLSDGERLPDKYYGVYQKENVVEVLKGPFNSEAAFFPTMFNLNYELYTYPGYFGISLDGQTFPVIPSTLPFGTIVYPGSYQVRQIISDEYTLQGQIYDINHTFETTRFKTSRMITEAHVSDYRIMESKEFYAIAERYGLLYMIGAQGWIWKINYTMTSGPPITFQTLEKYTGYADFQIIETLTQEVFDFDRKTVFNHSDDNIIWSTNHLNDSIPPEKRSEVFGPLPNDGYAYGQDILYDDTHVYMCAYNMKYNKKIINGEKRVIPAMCKAPNQGRIN